VVSDPLSVTIGSNAVVLIPTANLTYQRQFVVLVVDASGRAKANVDIIPSIDLDHYWKGSYSRGTSRWGHVFDGGCANEDINRNGILEAAEDINHSNAIEPRKSDVAVSILGSGKTDASGSAVVQIEYPQNIATWARVNILVAATGVSGTEGRATWTEVLPAPEQAFTGTAAPAFIDSPYGIVDFAMDPTSFSNPLYPMFPIVGTGGNPPKFPDGTPIPSVVITDACKNPY
jgi:hypothetical protein